MEEAAEVEPVEVRARRAELGLSPGELAELLGADQAQVAGWEHDMRPIPETLSVDLAELERMLGDLVEDLLVTVCARHGVSDPQGLDALAAASAPVAISTPHDSGGMLTGPALTLAMVATGRAAVELIAAGVNATVDAR